MSKFDWESFLKEESKKAIEQYKKDKNKYEEQQSRDYWYRLPDEAIESEWLGFSGASEEEILAAETRLGTAVSPSYRDFLKVTNGWLYCSDFLGLRSTEEIEWLYVENQGWIDEWIAMHKSLPLISDEEYFAYEKNSYQPLRTEYLKTALQISDDEEGDILLLNPQIIVNNEWEAWTFSCRQPGANRYRSFKEMLQTTGMTILGRS